MTAPGERERLHRLASALTDAAGGRAGGRPGWTIEGHDQLLELPPAAGAALAVVCSMLAAGTSVTAVATAPMVTTEAAARLLGVSRPTVVRMLNAGCLPYQRLNSHRRLDLGDVLAHRQSLHCPTGGPEHAHRGLDTRTQGEDSGSSPANDVSPGLDGAEPRSGQDRQ